MSSVTYKVHNWNVTTFVVKTVMLLLYSPAAIHKEYR
jgi:hypothetical protein